MKTGIKLISKERKKQIKKLGYDIEHDLNYNEQGELVIAARALISGNNANFPASWDIIDVQKMCDKPYSKRLVIAGTLIAAELDRILAIEKKTK